MSMTAPNRRRGFTDATLQRLAAWRRGCERDWTTAEIAADLRITVAALQRCVLRARAAGHPDAVMHPRAALYTAGTGFSHVASPAARARRVRYLQRTGADR
jgi:hypothetical protein